MATPKDFATKAVISINSVHIGTAQSISWGNEIACHPIHLVIDGLAGMFRGTAEFHASITMVLLYDGTEIDLEKLALNGENVEISIMCGAKTITTKGWITKAPQFEFGIDKPVDAKFEFTGSPEYMS